MRASTPSPVTPRITTRAAAPALRGWVGDLWAGGAAADGPAGIPQRERVLPTGHMHLAIRVTGPRLRLYASSGDGAGRTVGYCIVGGARHEAYLRAVDGEAGSVGVELLPGAARTLLGVPADVLAGAHWCLEDFWGPAAARLRERLIEAGDAGAQLALLEEELTLRLGGAPRLHPAVAHGLARLRAGEQVGTAVREAGISHRRFVTLFRESVGLTPQAWGRMLRFRRALGALATDGSAAAVAATAEYFDQPHFGREFRRITGLTPLQYRRIAPRHPNHVPLTA